MASDPQVVPSSQLPNYINFGAGADWDHEVMIILAMILKWSDEGKEEDRICWFCLWTNNANVVSIPAMRLANHPSMVMLTWPDKGVDQKADEVTSYLRLEEGKPGLDWDVVYHRLEAMSPIVDAKVDVEGEEEEDEDEMIPEELPAKKAKTDKGKAKPQAKPHGKDRAKQLVDPESASSGEDAEPAAPQADAPKPRRKFTKAPAPAKRAPKKRQAGQSLKGLIAEAAANKGN